VRLVVDANIVFGSLLRADGAVGDIFFNSQPPLVLFAPETLREEIADHRDKLLNLSKQPPAVMDALERLTLARITFLNEALISTVSWAKARALMVGLDDDDTVYVALAIQLKTALWTGDKRLRKGLLKNGSDLTLDTATLRSILPK
jgi:predicted nucleic acid-binding protein